MIWVKGPNGAVAGVSDIVAKALVGDGSRGYTLVPDSAAKAEHKPAPKKRAPRKPKHTEE